MKYISFPFSLLLFILFAPGAGWCQLKHSTQTLYPSYKGLIMAGYQGWFRAAGDGSGAKNFAYGDEKRCGIEQTSFAGLDGQPSDHYLWLTGEAAKRLRKEKPLEYKMPLRN